MQKRTIIIILLFALSVPVFSQPLRFSLSTDVSGLRSLQKGQRYWSIGQTVTGNFHFNSANTAYIWVSYYNDGQFRNELTAAAKSPATTPQQIPYSNKAKLGFRHVSIGWKRYFKGSFDIQQGWNLYGYGGFGLMIGRVTNTHSVIIDSADYNLPVVSGKGNFRRLTFDLGLGYEIALGGDLFFYAEARTLIPASDYPSQYLFVNKEAPFTAAVNLGFRIFFN